MTCKEKFIKDHPDYSEKQLNSIFDNDCPSDYGIMDDPSYCGYSCSCCVCWDRDIPETEPCEPSEETNNELVKRIVDLEQRNINQCDLIEKKTAELAISHARIAELTGELEESNKIKEEQLKVINELQARRNALEKELINEKERFENIKNHCEYLVDNHKRNLDAKDNDIKILEGKIAEHAKRKIVEAFCSTSSSCALSEDDICHAIALSMFNKYHALLDVGFSSDEALKLTIMWKD